MVTMNIEQAEKLLAEIIQEFKDSKINFENIDKFLIEFIELLSMEKFSKSNIHLFSNFVLEYFQDPNPANFKKMLPLIKVYINIMNNPSKYESESITTI